LSEVWLLNFFRLLLLSLSLSLSRLLLLLLLLLIWLLLWLWLWWWLLLFLFFFFLLLLYNLDRQPKIQCDIKWYLMGITYHCIRILQAVAPNKMHISKIESKKSDNLW
jgi:hypothetical protein